MNETKIKQRFENAFNAFFAENKSNEFNSLAHTRNAEMLRNETEISALTSDAFKNLIRQIVLFFPGTFVLFIISFACSVIFVSNPYGATMPMDRAIWTTICFLAAIFMTWLGIGDSRKPKHFVIPLSVISTGIVLGTISGILTLLSERIQRIVWTDDYPLYLLPIALIVPFLAKGLVDRKKD